RMGKICTMIVADFDAAAEDVFDKWMNLTIAIRPMNRDLPSCNRKEDRSEAENDRPRRRPTQGSCVNTERRLCGMCSRRHAKNDAETKPRAVSLRAGICGIQKMIAEIEPRYCFAARIASVSAGTTSNRSPAMP